MAIVWCSPSPRKHPQRSQEQQQEEEDEEDENVQQLQDCARLYKCLEEQSPNPTARERGTTIRAGLFCEVRYPSWNILPEEGSEEKFVTHKISEKCPRQDCLVKTDRNWRACQTEVKALKECLDAMAKKQAPSSQPATVSQ